VAAAGPPAFTVCEICQQCLIERQVVQDQQLEFEREVTRHRLFNQDLALKFAHERMQWAAHFQAARLGLIRRSPLGYVLLGVRWTAVTLFKVVRYVSNPR